MVELCCEDDAMEEARMEDSITTTHTEEASAIAEQESVSEFHHHPPSHKHQPSRVYRLDDLLDENENENEASATNTDEADDEGDADDDGNLGSGSEEEEDDDDDDDELTGSSNSSSSTNESSSVSSALCRDVEEQISGRFSLTSLSRQSSNTNTNTTSLSQHREESATKEQQRSNEAGRSTSTGATSSSVANLRLEQEIQTATLAARKSILKDCQRRPDEELEDISWLDASDDSDEEESLDYTDKSQHDHDNYDPEGPIIDSDTTKETQAMWDSSMNSLGAAARRKLFRRRKNRMTASDRSANNNNNNRTMDSSMKIVETVDPTKNNTQPETNKEYAFALCLGTTLTFNMGFVNGACFSGFLVAGVKEPVAGYTTPYTDFALELAEGNYDRVIFQTIMVLCFVGGSFVSGVATPNAVPYRIEPTYGPSFLLAGICLCFSSFFAAIGQYNNVVFYLAAAGGGVQNGISSAYTAKLIRSTGLTGSSTDIGLYFGQYVRGNQENKSKLLVLIMLTIAFTLGGFVAFYITQIFTSLTLLVSAVLFLMIGMSIMVFLVKKLSISFRAAVLGTWKWQAAAKGIKSVFAQAMDMDGSALHTMSAREIDEMFDRIDSDGNGTIDGEELYILLRSTGAKVSREESDMMLQYADRDGDGCLNRDEWQIIVQTALTQRKSMMERTKSMVGSTVNMTQNVVGSTVNMTQNVVGSTVGITKNVAASTRDLMGSSTRNIMATVGTTKDKMGSSARHLLASTRKVPSFKHKKGKRRSQSHEACKSDFDTSDAQQDSSEEQQEQRMDQD